MMEALRTRLRARPIMWLSVAAVTMLLLGVGIGAASPSQELEDKDDRIAELEDQLDGLRAELDSTEAEASSAEQAADRARERSRRKLDALAEREQAVAAREREVKSAERTLEQSTIPDGIWQLGRDYEAGTYRAPGGSGCYWALLGSADTSDIINNGGFGPNQTITIDSPFFETRDCGEWVKLG